MRSLKESINVADRLHKVLTRDPVLQNLGIEIEEAKRGRVVLSMAVSHDKVNGAQICHGGMLFTLADSALAYCFLTTEPSVVTRNANIHYMSPAHLNETVFAEAKIAADGGRNKICEVILTTRNNTIAHFTGQGTVPSPGQKG